MFLPKLLQRASSYSFMCSTIPSHTETEAASIESINRELGLHLSAPVAVYLSPRVHADLLHTADIGAFSTVNITGSPDVAYCKLGKYSKYRIDASEATVFPYQVCSIVGKDYCDVSVELCAYQNFYTIEGKGIDEVKKRRQPKLSGLGFNGDMFELFLRFSHLSIYMDFKVLSGELEITFKELPVVTCPQGFYFTGTLYYNKGWQWRLKNQVKEFMRNRNA